MALTRQQLEQQLVAAHRSGNVQAAQQAAYAIRAYDQAPLSAQVPDINAPPPIERVPKPTFGSWLDNLNYGIGEGLGQQVQGIGGMIQRGVTAFTQDPLKASAAAVMGVLEPWRQGLTQPVQAAKDVGTGIVETGKEMYKQATGGPVSLGTLIGQNIDILPGPNMPGGKRKPTMAELDVYHGTPHTFEPEPGSPLGRFRSEKIGTGEGAQAYGHGLYLAEDQKVAGEYKATLERTHTFINGKQVSPGEPNYAAATQISIYGYDNALKKVLDDANASWMTPEGRQQNLALADEIRSLKNTKVSAEKTGSVYKVDLPDTKIEQMLDWDKPINQQSPYVRNALQSLKRQLTESDLANLDGDTRLLFGPDVSVNQFLNTWEALRGSVGAGEKLLQEAGVPGVKYLDRGSRDGSKATRNFVVFPGEEQSLTVLERNGKKAPVAPKAEELAYHGTTKQAAAAIEKEGFDLTRSADGTVWLTSNPNIGEVAATGKGGIVSRSVSGLKLGSWDEADKYSTDELIAKGYDGLRLKDGDEITYQIFNPEKLQMPKTLVAPKAAAPAMPQVRQFAPTNLPTVKAGGVIDGYTVRPDVPNTASIGASLDDYEVLPGIRSVPMSDFDPDYIRSISYDKLDTRTKNLVDEIKQSKEISPLIVAYDDQGAYIIEGGHRFDAMIAQNAKSVPAVVVLDKSNPPNIIENTTVAPKPAAPVIDTTKPKREQLRQLHQQSGVTFVDSTIDRGGAHTPAGPTSGSPAYDVSLNGTYPEDFYGANGLRYYGTGYDAMDSQAYDKLRRLEGNPNAAVEIYRAVEKDGPKTISPGDWVTTVRDYAKDHGESALNGDYKIIKKLVNARDIYTAGDSMLEYGYHPQPRMPQLPKAGVSMPAASTPRVATWFSGGGTVESALPNHERVMAAEYNPQINAEANKAHGTSFPTRDVNKIDPQELKDAKPDLFHASPVCKNFSAAKTLRGATELDRESAQSVANAIRVATPPVVTIENVPQYADTALFKQITDALDAKGYKWDVVIHDAADYGAPQSRKRMLLRAVREGDLPPLPPKTGGGDWYAAVSDLLPNAPDSVIPPVERRRLDDMIASGKLDPSKPIITMGGSGFKNTWAAANAGGVAPTLKAANEKPRVIMPDGTVKTVTGRMMARLMGLGDDVPVPDNPTLAKTVLGNGVSGDVTRALIAPLLNRPK